MTLASWVHIILVSALVALNSREDDIVRLELPELEVAKQLL